jgi:hypothetical protein
MTITSSIARPSKIYANWDFCLKIYHLATMHKNHVSCECALTFASDPKGTFMFDRPKSRSTKRRGRRASPSTRPSTRAPRTTSPSGRCLAFRHELDPRGELVPGNELWPPGVNTLDSLEGRRGRPHPPACEQFQMSVNCIINVPNSTGWLSLGPMLWSQFSATFDKFRRKMTFFSKTNVMINFF